MGSISDIVSDLEKNYQEEWQIIVLINRAHGGSSVESSPIFPLALGQSFIYLSDLPP